MTCVKLSQQKAAAIPRWLCQTCRGAAPARKRFVLDQGFDLPGFISARRATTRTVQFIPNGARTLAAASLKKLLDRVVETNSICDWVRLLAFPLGALYIPPKTEEEDVTLTTKIKRQINTFMEAEFLPELDMRNSDLLTRPPPDGKATDPDDVLRRRIARKFREHDLKGAIRELSSTDGLAPYSPETLEIFTRTPPST